MAHKRKDTLAEIKKGGRWNKHLRPLSKRIQAQRERRAANKEIEKQKTDEQ